MTFAAAICFLSRVDEVLGTGHRIGLAEAFLSNKPEPTGHDEDADRIFERFWDTEPESLQEHVSPILPIIDGVPSVHVF